MNPNRLKKISSTISREEYNRRKREGFLIVSIIVAVAALTFAENRVIHFGADFPVSNTILMFILININLLLLILLIFLVFRNLVKLLYDRKRKVMGANLRVRLVVAFIAFSLLPTIVLFFFSINFITNSIEFWFNVPVEQALENSLEVGRTIYKYAEDTNRFYLERVTYQIKKKKLLQPRKSKALTQYIKVVQREFNLSAIEVYSATANRLVVAVSTELEDKPIDPVSADNLQKGMETKSPGSIKERFAGGELIRTIGSVPFGAKATQVEAFVVLSNLIPPNLSEKMSSIARGFEEYQQIKLLKKPIQITYLGRNPC